MSPFFNRIIRFAARRLFGSNAGDIVLRAVVGCWSKQLKTNIPLAVYDCRSNPVTFDFFSFLIAAHTYFYARGLERFDVLIYPISNLEFTRGQTAETCLINNRSIENYRRRVDKLLIPVANNFPFVGTVVIVRSLPRYLMEYVRYNQAKVFPLFSNPFGFQSFDYSNFFLKLNTSKNILKNRSLVSGTAPMIYHKSKNLFDKFCVINIRNSLSDPSRNFPDRDLPVLVELLDELAIVGIFIDDVESPLGLSISGHLVISDCTIDERIWLYRNSKFSISSNTGPLGMTIFYAPQTFIFKMCCENSIYGSQETLMRIGLTIGSQPVDEGCHFYWGESFQEFCVFLKSKRNE